MQDVVTAPPGYDWSWLPELPRQLLETHQEWGWGDTLLIPQDSINAFALLTGDDNPLHTQKGVVHGMLLVSLLPTLLKPVFSAFMDGGITLIDEGCRDLRFTSFARAGRLVCARMRVFSTQVVPNNQDITFSFLFSIGTKREGAAPHEIVVGSRTLRCFSKK